MSGTAREFIGKHWPVIGTIGAIGAGQWYWLGGVAVVVPALLVGLWCIPCSGNRGGWKGLGRKMGKASSWP